MSAPHRSGIARLLASLVAGLVLFGVWIMARSAMPELAADDRGVVDRAIAWNLWITGAVFVAAHIALAAAVLKASGPRIAESARLELVWTLATGAVLVLLLLVAERDVRTLASADDREPPLELEVVGQQFAWNFRLAGEDGLFGRTDPKQQDQAELNFIGLDRTDPAAEDDVVFPQGMAVVPRDRDIRLRIRSLDVIHSFFVPALRLKRDAVPGIESQLTFRATRSGEFEVACAEHCGLGHYRMRAVLTVVDPAAFAERVKEATQ